MIDPAQQREDQEGRSTALGWDCGASLGTVVLVLKCGQEAPGWLVMLGLALASGLLVRPLVWLMHRHRGT